jgi:hypothetical protein
MKAMLLDRTTVIEKNSVPLRYAEVELPYPRIARQIRRVIRIG